MAGRSKRKGNRGHSNQQGITGLSGKVFCIHSPLSSCGGACPVTLNTARLTSDPPDDPVVVGSSRTITMTTFQSINVGLPSRDFTSGATTPTTPRAPANNVPQLHQNRDMANSPPPTPTKTSFGGMGGQRPLPSSACENNFPATLQSPNQSGLNRENSQRSVRSSGSQDVDMDDSEEEEDGSDGESIDGETGRPSKKKKGQRFFCTDYPPCQLSFTRSEHLARHIR